MQTAAPASARAHRCAGMTAVQACAWGGADSHAQPCFLVLPDWPRTGTGLPPGQEDVPPSPEHLGMAPCVPLCWAMGMCPDVAV